MPEPLKDASMSGCTCPAPYLVRHRCPVHDPATEKDARVSDGAKSDGRGLSSGRPLSLSLGSSPRLREPLGSPGRAPAPQGSPCGCFSSLPSDASSRSSLRSTRVAWQRTEPPCERLCGLVIPGLSGSERHAAYRLTASCLVGTGVGHEAIVLVTTQPFFNKHTVPCSHHSVKYSRQTLQRSGA